MRVGALIDLAGSATSNRSTEPLHALARRGHQIVPVGVHDGRLELDALETCDVVHLYRQIDAATLAIASRLAGRGVGVVWDNDSDESVPRPAAGAPTASRPRAEQRARFQLSVEIARWASGVTVTTEPLARLYREAGVPRVDVIPDAVLGGDRTPRPHPGLVVGWVADLDDWTDVSQLGIGEALQRLMDAHPNVRVECIGADLELCGHYRHASVVADADRLGRMAAFDIGIAPLADVPFNHSRSSIQVKEYAASGVPWLASDLTPYAPLGADHGGALVDPGGWLDALDRLVRDEHRRRRLARSGRAWGTQQTIQATADRWEQAFLDAATNVGPRTSLRPTAREFRRPAGGFTSSGAVRRAVRRPS